MGRVRSLGWLSFCVGIVLIGIMGVVLVYTLPPMLHPGVKVNGYRFDGSPGMLLFAFGVYAALILFGLNALAGGFWQIRTGRKPRWSDAIAYAGFGLFVLAGVIARVVKQ